MRKEDYNHFIVLTILSQSEFLSHKDYIDKLTKAGVDFTIINNKYITDNYDGFGNSTKYGDKSYNKYAITYLGRSHLLWLKLEKDKEDIDSKLKTISYNSIRLNKMLPIWSLIVAAMAMLITASDKCSDRFVNVNLKIESKGIDTLTQKVKQPLQTVLQNPDSLVKILNADTLKK